MRVPALAALLLLGACSPTGCTPAAAPETGGAPATDIHPGDPVPPDASEPPPETPPAEPEAPPAPAPVDWPHDPGGALVPGSGGGATDITLWAPGIRFPIEVAPAFANSQVYGYGGFAAPGPGGQCDARNYAYPWHDNFCETRSWVNGMCPSGHGHQGQDIRPSTCEKKVHWVVAPEAGEVTSIGSYTVTLLGTSGRIYRFLHMDMAGVHALFPNAASRHVARGQHLGRVSNDFGGSATTIHMHFEIKAPVAIGGSPVSVQFVPGYSSLVDSYGHLLNGAP